MPWRLKGGPRGVRRPLAGGTGSCEFRARAELIRRRATTNLKELMMLERTRGLSVMRIRSMATIRNPKQIAASSGQPEEKKASALEKTANDLTTQKFSRAYEVEDVVARLAEALTDKAARSVLLVGKAGVGKTAVFNELVSRRRVRPRVNSVLGDEWLAAGCRHEWFWNVARALRCCLA